MKLGEALFYEQPTKYIVESEFYNNNYKTPVLTAGKSFILGYTNETNGIYNNLPCIIFDDFTTDIKYVDFPFKVKSSAMKILTTNDENDLRYLYYFLSTIKLDTELHKRYWISKYAELNVKLPLLPEQERIAGELDVVCGAMEKQKKQLELCDTLIKSKFNEMFGDKSFEKCAIKKLIDNKISKIKNKFSNNEIIQYIDISSIDNSQQIITGSKKFNVSNAPSRAQYVLKRNDILISTVRPNLRNVAVVKTEDINIIGSTGFCVLRCNEKVIEEYLFYIVSSEKVANMLMNVVRGANYPAVSDEDVKNIQIPLPPLPLQQKFADFVNEVEQNKAKIKESLNETETLYKALMQKYFDKGEV